MLTVIKKHLAKQVKCLAYFCKKYVWVLPENCPPRKIAPGRLPAKEILPWVRVRVRVRVRGNLPGGNFP